MRLLPIKQTLAENKSFANNPLCNESLGMCIEFYKRVGRKSAKIISKRVMPICNEYSMVVVRWGVTFEKTGARLIEFDISYIVQETGIAPKIILLISHEDEGAAMKKLGLEPVLH